ncbi:MAG: condensation domain-containing protein, partial [Tumebacillaceae bacterium]
GIVDIRFIDLSDLPADSRKDEALRFAQEEADRPFDLQNGPLFRAQLIRLDDEEQLLVVNFHHIISDGASIEVFENELAALYAAFTQGEPSPLDKLPIQYADYAHWQRDQLQGELMEQQEAYWRGQLAGELPLLQLPTVRPRPEMVTYHGSTAQLTLPAGLVEGLQQLAKREDSTMFMLLLAAWKTLLYRYSGQEDLLVGVPVSNRTRSELEPLIGFFVNTLVIRTDFSASANFLALLQQVRQTVLAAYDNQDIPFDHLVEILLPDRDISRSPLFQVMFSYEGTSPKLATAGLEMERIDSEIHTSKFDLSLSMKENGPYGLEAIVEYNTDLFDRLTMERMLANLHTLLQGIADDPTRLVSDLPILSEQERQIVLVDWNQTASDYPSESSIQQLFEQQAERSPDAVAVVLGEQRMTYRELNEQGNRLAHHLLASGLQPGQPVGIAMDRSLEMLVGMLGILKAGGAYVPLDSSYPVERLAFMIRDTQAEILLTQMEKRDALALDGLTVICLDGEGDWVAASTANPKVPFSRDQLAYIMYTSGSTGTPKGVCIPHHAVVRLVKDTDFVSFGAEEVFLQSAPTSFDAATFEIWGSLL